MFCVSRSSSESIAYKVVDLPEPVGPAMRTMPYGVFSMSRTSFSLHFAELTGLAPLAYLTRWRMIKAAQLLRRGNATLAEIAAQVGYGSEAAFSIAVKRAMGIAPGRYRMKKPDAEGVTERARRTAGVAIST